MERNAMKAIAFDFDGTLIDSMGMWRNLGRNFVESKGKVYTDAIHEKITTMSLRQSSAFFKQVLELDESPEAIFDEMGAIIRDGYDRTLPLKAGAMDALKKAARLAPVVLATATGEELLTPAVRRFHMEPYFQFIQTCDQVGIEKSDVRFYEILAERLDVAPDEILFLDDAHYALSSAKEAGFFTIGVKDDSNDPYWEAIVKTSDETLHTLADFQPEKYF